MAIPTEPIGSIPRPVDLLAAMGEWAAGKISEEQLHAAESAALRDTIQRLEATGSPVVSDGEQTKPSFATYPLTGIQNLASDGVTIPFADGHTRQLPRLTKGPFRYGILAAQYLKAAQELTRRPVKQAVISASALSLLYPQGGLNEYSREAFLGDLIQQAVVDIRDCLAAQAACVQIDFTEARLSLKLDPSGGLLNSFIELNNQVLRHFSDDERKRIGVHTCPGGDRDSTHSADVDYASLLPALFQMKVGRFYVQLASEADRRRVLETLRTLLRPGQLLFVGVTDPISPAIESPETVRDRVLEAASSFRSRLSAQPTIADSLRLPTTHLRRAKRHSRKLRAVWKELPWRRRLWACRRWLRALNAVSRSVKAKALFTAGTGDQESGDP